MPAPSMKKTDTSLVILSFCALLLSGCAGISSKNNTSVNDSEQTATLPHGLPKNAATHDPAEQRILMQRDLYRTKDGAIRPLTSIKEPDIPEPMPSRQEKRKTVGDSPVPATMKPVVFSVDDARRLSND